MEAAEVRLSWILRGARRLALPRAHFLLWGYCQADADRGPLCLMKVMTGLVQELSVASSTYTAVQQEQGIDELKSHAPSLALTPTAAGFHTPQHQVQLVLRWLSC